MSWSFEIRGKDKAKLKAAARAQLFRINPEAERLGSIIDAAIDAAVISPQANHMCFRSSGHADANQCYFSIDVVPIYTPKLVDDQ